MTGKRKCTLNNHGEVGQQVLCPYFPPPVVNTC